MDRFKSNNSTQNQNSSSREYILDESHLTAHSTDPVFELTVKALQCIELSFACFRLGKYDQAAEAMEIVIEIAMEMKPLEPFLFSSILSLIYFELGMNYYKLGKYNKAIEATEKAIALNPEDEYYNQLEKIYLAKAEISIGILGNSEPDNTSTDII